MKTSMKRLMLITIAACAWIGIQAEQTNSPITKTQVEKSDSLVFNTYWQSVYEVISHTPAVSEMLLPRLQLFTTQTEKFFGAALPVENQRLFARNLQVFFTYSVMERYLEVYGKKVKRNLKEKEAALVLNDFYRRTDHRGKEAKSIYAMSSLGLTLEYPEDFFVEQVTQYPKGEEAAIKYLSEHLIYQARNNQNEIPLKLSIDKDGNVNNIVEIQGTDEKAYLLSMPKWEPKRLTNGEQVASEVYLTVPFVKVSSPKFKQKGISANNYLSDKIPYEEALDGNYLQMSFVLTQKGKVAEPVDIKMFTTITELVPDFDYYKRRTEEVIMTDSLKGAIKQIVLAMPEWEVPALSLNGTKSVITSISTKTFRSKANTDSISSRESDVFFVIEKHPEFPGGMSELMKYLQKNIIYPTEAKSNGIQGRVIVQFVVGEDGSITEPVVTKSVNPYLDSEAVRVVKNMPKWNPAKQQGDKPVRVKFTIPVQFRLQ